MTPEYFSRVLHELEAKGLIEMDKREIRIPDPQRLIRFPTGVSRVGVAGAVRRRTLPSMLILGFESSCDETGVALVDASGTATPRLLGHALHSQIEMHQAYGGVVPELASRDHIRRVLPLTESVMQQAALPLSAVDAIAYTRGPGLAGALLVGSGVACAMAMALDKPAMGVHHLEGHLLSPFLSADPPEFPFVALLVSGGHTQLMRVDGVGRYALLGETIDDAAGEAFDKSAKLLGLGYPGGPALSRLAEQGNATAYKFPRPLLHSGDLDFSFAGLKTAVLTQVKRLAHARPEGPCHASVGGAARSGSKGRCRRQCSGRHRRRAGQKVRGRREAVGPQTPGGGRWCGRQQLVARAAQRRVRAPGLARALPRAAFVHRQRRHDRPGRGLRFQAGLLKPESGEAAYRFDVLPRWPLSALSG